MFRNYGFHGDYGNTRTQKGLPNALRSKVMNTTRVVGVLDEPSLYRVRHALEFLHRDLPEQFAAPECTSMMEYQWAQFTQQLRKAHRAEVWAFSGSVAVFCNEHFIGGEEEFLQWATDHHGYLDDRPPQTYEGLAKEAYNAHITNPERTFVFMDVCIDGDLVGRLVFELYSNLCPRTTANFTALCTGERGTSEAGTRLSYVNSLFHRVVPSGWIQGGDICGGSGAKGESIYGPTFEDECFAVPHDMCGVVGMANSGRNTNSSQFYITLSPAPWMDKQYVAFGRVVEGSKVLHKLAAVETYNERPKLPCQVSNCGLLHPLT